MDFYYYPKHKPAVLPSPQLAIAIRFHIPGTAGPNFWTPLLLLTPSLHKGLWAFLTSLHFFTWGYVCLPYGYTQQDQETDAAEQAGSDALIQQRTCAHLSLQPKQQPSGQPLGRELRWRVLHHIRAQQSEPVQQTALGELRSCLSSLPKNSTLYAKEKRNYYYIHFKSTLKKSHQQKWNFTNFTLCYRMARYTNVYIYLSDGALSENVMKCQSLYFEIR